MANFMLYHVPDIHLAIRELKRVLKPGGLLMAATNSQSSMESLWKLHVACQRQASIPEPIVLHSVPDVRFSLENGADFLRPHFPWFESKLLHDTLKFTEAGPLLDYYRSGFMTMGDTKRQIPEEQWRVVADLMRERVEQSIRRDGCFVVPKSAGVFVAGV